MNLVGLRASARIARRSAIRHRKRTILILVLIAVPVAAAIVVAGISRANKIDPERFVSSRLGTADIRVTMSASEPKLEDWFAAQIDNEPFATYTKFRMLEVDYGAGVELYDTDVTNKLTQGLYVFADGTAPSRSNQVALSVSSAASLQAVVGDTVDMAFGPTGVRPYILTGLVHDPVSVRRRFAIITPAEMDNVIARIGPTVETHATVTPRATWLVSGVDSSFTSKVANDWKREARKSWPPPAVDPRPPELAAISDEIYYSLDAAAIKDLVDLAPELDEEALRDAAQQRVTEYVGLSSIWINVESRDEMIRSLTRNESVLGGPPAIGAMVAAFLLVEVALVAAAAYATGTRRRLRELGLLGSTGATEAHIRMIVVGEGVAAGLAGAALGAAMAGVVLVAGRGFMQLLVDQLIIGVPITVADILVPAFVGILAATIAAWIPARTAANVPPVIALQGRMPPKTPRHWTVPVGLGLVGFGAALIIVANLAVGQGAGLQAGLGVVLMIGGTALLTGPVVTVFGRQADRLRATPRLVLRDASRQRARTSVAMAAVMGILLAPIIVGVASGNQRARDEIQGLPSPNNHVVLVGPMDRSGNEAAGYATTEDVAAVQDVLPDSTAVFVTTLDAAVVFEAEMAALEQNDASPAVDEYLRDSLGNTARAAVETPRLIAALGSLPATQALESGQAVVLGVENRSTTVTINDVRIEATELAIAVVRSAMPRLILPVAMVDDLGLQPAGTKALIVTDRPLTVTQINSIWDLEIGAKMGPNTILSTDQLLWIVLGGTFFVVLVIIGLITAVSATESDRDLATMVAVGASPISRRWFLGLQAAFLTSFGGLLAAPLGWLLVRASTTNRGGIAVGPFGSVPSSIATVPWGVIAVVVLVIPAAVGGVTALVVKSSPTMPARQAL